MPLVVTATILNFAAFLCVLTMFTQKIISLIKMTLYGIEKLRLALGSKIQNRWLLQLHPAMVHNYDG